MRRFLRAPKLLAPLGLLTLALLVPAGCSQNPMVLQGQVQKSQQEQLALTRQNEQLQGRTNTLDRDNQELGTMLAQSRQRAKVLEDEMAAVRDQLTDVTTQLAKARDERDASDNRAKAMTASMQRHGGVTISPNSSVQQTLPSIDLPGIETRRDGDVIRIVLPADRLFDPGTARLRVGADKLITQVGGELARVYPGQRIGVEGHMDNAPVSVAPYRNHHEVSVAWAVAVYNVLTTQSRLPSTALFVTGHGANHPVYSNGPADGQQRNRRVELVVYPERVGG
jgi:flagellar motor protein MotB